MSTQAFPAGRDQVISIGPSWRVSGRRLTDSGFAGAFCRYRPRHHTVGGLPPGRRVHRTLSPMLGARHFAALPLQSIKERGAPSPSGFASREAPTSILGSLRLSSGARTPSGCHFQEFSRLDLQCDREHIQSDCDVRGCCFNPVGGFNPRTAPTSNSA
jgi:hypothetical protein